MCWWHQILDFFIWSHYNEVSEVLLVLAVLHTKSEMHSRNWRKKVIKAMNSPNTEITLQSYGRTDCASQTRRKKCISSNKGRIRAVGEQQPWLYLLTYRLYVGSDELCMAMINESLGSWRNTKFIQSETKNSAERKNYVHGVRRMLKQMLDV